MKNDLISRDEAIEMLKKALNHRYNASFTAGDAFATALHRIKKLPAVDAEPVRHGGWKDRLTHFECSVCGRKYPRYSWEGDAISYYWCPNCGARMYGEQEG